MAEISVMDWAQHIKMDCEQNIRKLKTFRRFKRIKSIGIQGNTIMKYARFYVFLLYKLGTFWWKRSKALFLVLSSKGLHRSRRGN